MRFRITMTVVQEFEVNPEFYPDAKTTEEMLEIDLDNMREDPVIMLALDEPESLTVTGEVLD